MENKKVYILFVYDDEGEKSIIGAYSSQEKLDKVLDNELDEEKCYIAEEVELQ